MKNIVALCSSRFTVELIWCIAFDKHLVFVVYLNLLQLAYNIFQNRDILLNNQLCNHRLDQLQFFKFYHMFFNNFFAG